jgi:serine/threonine protein kinase
MNSIPICPSCGNSLPPDAPGGLCPVCLLKMDPSAKPAPKAKSGEPISTLTIGPEAFVRVRYFGDYELLEEIARGGMGVVWKARQASLNRTVAVKMILAGKLADEAEVQRFHREAEAAANLQHPNIVAIHEVGEHDGQHYYSMDYVQGRDLGALVRESGPLPPARAAECLQTIAEAVHFAHQRGTLHRDLKPQNVLMDAAGVPRITDFGLAKFVERDDSLTQTGAVMGSPSYMPPEQAAGHLDQVGPHSDVYSLGAILYELLTVRPPFRAETAVATMRLVMESDPVAPRKLNAAVPPDLETICLKCLEKNPARRYPSARALAEELGRFLKHEPIQAVRVSAIRKAESWLRRHPWTLMAAGSLLVMVLAGLLYWQYERLKFLQHPSLPGDQSIRQRIQEIEAWNGTALVLLFMGFISLLVFRQYESWLRRHPWALLYAGLLVALFISNQVYWQFKFSENQPSLMDQGTQHPDLRGQELETWDNDVMGQLFLILLCACSACREGGLVTKRVTTWKLMSEPTIGLGPTRQLSQRMRIAYGLIGATGFGFALFYCAKIIEASAWDNPQNSGIVWPIFYLSFSLLFRMAQDYQKFLHGMPSRTLSAEQGESLRQAIFDGRLPSPVTLYRRAIPGATRAEAQDYIGKVAAKLLAAHPEKFARPWDLNWRLMGVCLVIEFGLCAGLWLVMPPVAPAVRLFRYTIGFVFGAGALLLRRRHSRWQRLLAYLFFFLLAWSGSSLVGPQLAAHSQPSFPGNLDFPVGIVLGVCLILSGFTRKRSKFTPDKRPLNESHQYENTTRNSN